MVSRPPVYLLQWYLFIKRVRDSWDMFRHSFIISDAGVREWGLLKVQNPHLYASSTSRLPLSHPGALCLASFTWYVFRVYSGCSIYQYLIPLWLDNVPLDRPHFMHLLMDTFPIWLLANNASNIGISVCVSVLSDTYLERSCLVIYSSFNF